MLFLPSFTTIGFLVQEEKRKIDFQDGRNDSHLFKMILAIFDLQVTLMLPTCTGELNIIVVIFC